MINRILLVIFIFTISTFFLHAQTDYYSTDSSKIDGIRLVNFGRNTNSQKCMVLQNGKSSYYTPDEVKEYGFKNGRVYFSRLIPVKDTVKRVFLERLAEGKISLYYYEGESGIRYFLEKDSSGLVEIIKRDTSKENFTFRIILENYMKEYDYMHDPIKLAVFRESSLVKLTELYNNGVNKPFPVTKFGFTFGIEKSTISKNENFPETELQNVVFNSDYAFTYGVFVDFPNRTDEISFRPELYYQKNAFKANIENNSITTEYVINTSSFSLPLIVRYSYPSKILRPFLNLGFLYSYSYVNKNECFSSRLIGNIIEDHYTQEKILSKNQYGYIIGAGVTYKITYRNFINIELRQNGLYDLSKNSFGINRIQLLTSFNF